MFLNVYVYACVYVCVRVCLCLHVFCAFTFTCKSACGERKRERKNKERIIPERKEYTKYTFISKEYPLSQRILRAFQVTANCKYIQVLSVSPRKLMIRSCILTFFLSPGQYAKYLWGELLVLSISVSFTDNFFIILEGRFSQEFNFCCTSHWRSSS